MQMLNDKLKQSCFKQIDLMLIPDAVSWATVTKLEELLVSYEIGTSCEAFIIDGDMAKNWKTLFSDWDKEKEVSSRERSVSFHSMSIIPQQDRDRSCFWQRTYDHTTI